ncbi:MAG: hypothetical protein Q9218_003091 [Villophora microphyllina]
MTQRRLVPVSAPIKARASGKSNRIWLLARYARPEIWKNNLRNSQPGPSPTAPNASQGHDMEDSISSVSLLETAGLTALLVPYDGPEAIRTSIGQLQQLTFNLIGPLRRFQRWTGFAEREIDTGLPPQQDVRHIFQEFSGQVTQYIEGLSKISALIYQRITACQRDGITDRDVLAEVHEKYEQANLEFARLANLWLFLQHASRRTLFGSPDHDPEPEDLVQPPPSPASDSGFEIMIDQAFALHSIMTQGVKSKELAPRSTGPSPPSAPSRSWHFALIALKHALRVLHIL